MCEEIPSLFIVGPMGAGKTTIGRMLAKNFQRQFIDTDYYIEQKTGADIPWIFEKEGEEGFRKREAQVVEELTALPNIVLATGGGVVMDVKNREYLKQRGLTIYLRASVDVQLKRTAKDKSRPLLNTPNPKEVLEQLFKTRDPLYTEIADIIIETGTGYPKHMLHKILKTLKHNYPEFIK